MRCQAYAWLCLYLGFYLPDTCSETVTTADDSIHGNSNKSSSVTDDVLPCNARSENIQSNIPVCNGEDSQNLEQLENTEVSKKMCDSQVFDVADKGIDTADENNARNAANPTGCEREVTVLFQDSSAELESNSETLVKSDKPFEPAGNCSAPNNEPIKECKQYDTELFSDIESSYNHNAVEYENWKSSVSCRMGDVSDSHHGSRASEGTEAVSDSHHSSQASEGTEAVSDSQHGSQASEGTEAVPDSHHGSQASEETEAVSDSHHGSQASEGTEADVHLFQELDGDFHGLDGDAEDSETALNDKSVDVELQNEETGSSRLVVQMQQDDLLEPSGKSADVEMGNDQTELSKKSADVGMQNNENEVSSDLSGQAGSNDSDDHTEHVSEDHGYDVTGPGMKPIDLEDKNTEAEQGDKLDEDTGAEQSDKFDKGTEVEQGGKFYKGTETEQGDTLGNDSEAGKGDSLDKDPEVQHDGNLCHMEKGYSEAEVWQTVSNDSKITNVKADEGGVLRTKASREHSDTVSPAKGTPFIELEHTLENAKGNKILTFLYGTNQHVFAINFSM